MVLGRRPALRLYASLFAGARWRLVLCVSLSTLQALTVLPVALLVRYVFDQALPAENTAGLLWAGLGITAAVLVSTGLALVARTQTLRVVKRAVSRLREQLADRLLILPRAFFTRSDRGTIHATIVQDTERLDSMSAEMINQFLPAVVVAVGLAAILAWLNWKLLAVMLTVWPISYLISRGMRVRVRGAVHTFRVAFEDYSRTVLRVLQSIDLVRMQTAEKLERTRQREAIENLRRESGRVAWEGAAHGAIQEALITLSAMVILLLGSWEVMRGRMSMGTLLSFYVASRSLNRSQGVLLAAVPTFIAGRESLNALRRLLSSTDMEHERHPYSAVGGQRADVAQGIQFQGVTFSYGSRGSDNNTTGTPLLQNLDLKIQPSTATAIIGPNGAGKSTLTYLLLGFYRPQAGRLLIGNQPYDSLDLSLVRQQIGVVPQDPFFFSGTIRENIIYGSDRVDAPTLESVLITALANPLIASLPAGLDTQIGEGGAMLSGGQRQRLALARALLRQPKLLILDEPTNHLDQAGAEELITRLLALSPAFALLIISHQDQLVSRLCDRSRIFRLQEGRLFSADER